MCHSDAAFDRDAEGKSQGGYFTGFSSDSLASGEKAVWCPAMWKSFKLRRACTSTLAAEVQTLLEGIRSMQWMGAMLAEAKFPDFTLRDRDEYIKKVSGPLMTDCKSAYDNIKNVGCPSGLKDLTAGLDVAIVKQELRRLGVALRWCPSERNIADGLTKDAAEPADLLRSILKSGEYVLAAEETVLQRKAEEKEERIRRGKARAAAAAERGSSGKETAGVRDYWLPMPSRHYLMKIASGLLEPQQIRKVRVHGIPRTKMMSPDEVKQTPQTARKLTIFREMLQDGKLGIVQHREDDINVEVGNGMPAQWVGATVFYNPQAGE